MQRAQACFSHPCRIASSEKYHVQASALARHLELVQSEDLTIARGSNRFLSETKIVLDLWATEGTESEKLRPWQYTALEAWNHCDSQGKCLNSRGLCEFGQFAHVGEDPEFCESKRLKSFKR